MLLKAYKIIKYKVSEDLKGDLVDQSSELKDNKAYLYKNLKIDEDSSKDDWLEEDSKCKNYDT